MKETVQNIFNIFYRPRVVFADIKKKKQNIMPLIVVSLTITLISSVGVIYLFNKAKEIVNYNLIANYTYATERIEQIANTQMVPYIVSLFISAVFSIVFVAIIMFAISRFLKYESTLVDIINIVSYSWCPMIISNLVTVVLMFVVPLERSFNAKTLVDYLCDKNSMEIQLYKIVSSIDPMYIWFLILLAFGLGVVYDKKKYKWYIATIVVWGLPILMNILNSFSV